MANHPEDSEKSSEKSPLASDSNPALALYKGMRKEESGFLYNRSVFSAFSATYLADAVSAIDKNPADTIILADVVSKLEAYEALGEDLSKDINTRLKPASGDKAPLTPHKRRELRDSLRLVKEGMRQARKLRKRVERMFKALSKQQASASAVARVRENASTTAYHKRNAAHIKVALDKVATINDSTHKHYERVKKLHAAAETDEPSFGVVADRLLLSVNPQLHARVNGLPEMKSEYLGHFKAAMLSWGKTADTSSEVTKVGQKRGRKSEESNAQESDTHAAAKPKEAMKARSGRPKK